MHFLAQTQVVNEATVDKLLGANFLSLALIALVMVVAMFLVFVFMDYRRQQSESGKQDTFLRVFTDNKSPMVVQQMRANDAIEKMVELQIESAAWHKQHSDSIEDTNSAIIALKRDVKERSELDGLAIDEARKDAETRHEKTLADIADLKSDIAKISDQIQKLIDDKADCVELRTDLENFEKRVMDKLATQPLNVVGNIHLDTAPAGEAERELPKAS